MDGLELRIARVRAGLTQYEFAKLAEVHPSRLSEMERGQREITPAVVAALDKLLRAEPEMVESEV